MRRTRAVARWMPVVFHDGADVFRAWPRPVGSARAETSTTRLRSTRAATTGQVKRDCMVRGIARQNRQSSFKLSAVRTKRYWATFDDSYSPLPQTSRCGVRKRKDDSHGQTYDPPQQRREEALRRQGRVGQIQRHSDLRACPSPGPEEKGRRGAQSRGEEEAVAGLSLESSKAHDRSSFAWFAEPVVPQISDELSNGDRRFLSCPFGAPKSGKWQQAPA